MFSVFEWFVLVLQQCDAFVVIVLSDEPRQKQGRGLFDRKLVKALLVLNLLLKIIRT